jgi:hypothetical protein
MTVIKYSNQERIVLDFSGDNLSKNQIKQALRSLSINATDSGIAESHYIINKIKVGMYNIRLFPVPMHGILKLRGFSNMFVQISEDSKFNTPIFLKNDGRFKNQYWVQQTNSPVDVQNVKIKTLVDIIKYCHRLNKLKAFL